MKEFFNLMKKAGNFYMRVIALSQSMTPTGSIPIRE